jgi:hypothetical protein
MARALQVTEATFKSSDPLVLWFVGTPNSSTANIPREARGSRTNGDANRFRKELVLYRETERKEKEKILRGRTKDIVLKKREEEKNKVTTVSTDAEAKSRELVTA